MTEWIEAAEAARRLGIKQASLYSYVSRGVLTRRRSPHGRGSMFRAAEVEGLARRGRPRRAPAAELVIETELTEIAGDQLRYRGRDVTELAGQHRFEEVCGLLWSGELADPAGADTWQAPAAAVAAGTAAQAGLPARTLPLERLQVVVPALAAADPLRLQLGQPAVIAAARSLIAGMIECLPLPPGGRAVSSGPIAARLASRLCPVPLPSGLTSALSAALVLLADHELAASTLAARVAASVRADPYAVVSAGLAALGGWLHGGASLGAEVMLASAEGPADAGRVVGDLLRRGERIPGFGHFVYQAGDPRAVLLMRILRQAVPGAPQLDVAEAFFAEARGRALPEPNIDFALAALAGVAGLIPGAGEAIFAVARVAGWIAHGLEEYARNIPIRPRAIYTGPPAAGL
ncbi:MAG TPA: citrate/2-methylcitrate synthase [Streptosporangiaceae bacterium]|jgi:citrate synthase